MDLMVFAFEGVADEESMKACPSWPEVLPAARDNLIAPFRQSEVASSTDDRLHRFLPCNLYFTMEGLFYNVKNG